MLSNKFENFYLTEESKKISNKWKLLGFLEEIKYNENIQLKRNENSSMSKNKLTISYLKRIFNESN